MIKRINEASRDQQGLTLIELVIGMALMSLIALLCGAIFVTSVRTQTDVSTATNTSGRASSFVTKFNKTIRSADNVRVRSNVWVDIKEPSGRCVAYVVYNNAVYRKTGNSAVTIFSTGTWVRVADNVSKVNGVDYFKNSPALGVEYSFSTGSGMGKANLVGIATPRVIQPSPGPCWS